MVQRNVSTGNPPPNGYFSQRDSACSKINERKMYNEIIGIACLSIIIVNFGKPADLLKRYLYGSDFSKWKRMKPLDCAFCLSWWLGLSFFLYTYGWVGILYASIATVIVALLETKL